MVYGELSKDGYCHIKHATSACEGIYIMSGICIVNLKEHHLKFEQLNCLANNLVSVALLRKKGIFFHVRDYAFDIIKDVKIKN